MLASLPLRKINWDSRLKPLFYGSASAALSRVLTTLLSLFSLPLTIRYLGPERYGVWVTVISTTTWVALLEFGVTDTLTNTISASHASGDRDTAARHTTNALLITLSFAFLLFTVGALAWPHIQWTWFFTASDTVSSAEIRQTAAIAGTLILFAPTCNIGTRILSGYQQTYAANLVTAAGAVVSMTGLLTGIWLRAPMPILFLCTMAFIPLSGMGTLVWVTVIGKPWLRPRIRYLNIALTSQLLSTGAPYFLIQIAGIVVFSTDNIVVGHFLGASQVTRYSVAMSLVMYAQLVPSFLSPSLWASYAEANARGDQAWIRRTYRWTMRSSMVFICAVLLLVAAFGRPVIRVWAGQAAVPSEWLLLTLCAWAIILGATMMQSCLLGAVGRTKVQGTVSVISAVMNLILSILFVPRIGAVGAVLGTLLSYVGIIFMQTREVAAFFEAASPTQTRSDISRNASG